MGIAAVIRCCTWTFVFGATIVGSWAQAPFRDHEAVAEDAAWCWFSDPRAVYHQGEREQVYFGYITGRGDVAISAKDLETGQVRSILLHEQLQVDDHNVPALLILPDGRLLVCYTEHNGRFFMRKSVAPEDIGAWEDERTMAFGGDRMTYAHLVMLSGEDNRIYVFWRGSDWRPTFAYSDDGGDTWSESHVLLASKGAKHRPYLKVTSDHKNRIDIAFTDGHPGEEPANSIYHVSYHNGHFYQSNGEQIASMAQLPLAHDDIDKVYDAQVGHGRSWISDIALDSSGHPVIVYTRYPAATDHRYHYAAWNGSRWIDDELCTAGGSMAIVRPGEKVREPHYSGGISLDHQNPGHVYLARDVAGTFEIEHWWKNGQNWRSQSITKASASDNMRPYVVSGYKAGKAIVLWMQGKYHHYTDFNTKLLLKLVGGNADNH